MYILIFNLNYIELLLNEIIFSESLIFKLYLKVTFSQNPCVGYQVHASGYGIMVNNVYLLFYLITT